MARFRLVAALLLFVTMLPASLATTTARAVDAQEWVVVQIEGTAEFKRNSPTWRTLRRGDTVVPGYVIRTGPKGKLLLVRDSETITIEPKSTLEFLAPGKGRVTRIFQKIGGAIFKIRERNRKHFEVLNPNMVATVKGTEFSIRTDSDGATVKVLNGTVGVTNKKSGKSVDVTEGRFAEIATNGGAIATGAAAVPTSRSFGYYAATVAIVSAILGLCLILYIAVLRKRARMASSGRPGKRVAKS